MHIRKSFFGVALVLSAISAPAQTVTGSGTAGTVPQFTGASSIGNSPIAISGGNVGIGTTSPGSKLDVEGGGIAVGNIPSLSANGAFGAAATDGHWMGLYPSLSPSSWNSIVQAGDHALIYADGGAGTGAFVIAPWATGPSGLRMDSSGNVGIGTATPSSRLEVNGDLKLSGGGASIKFWDSTVQSTAWTGVLTGGDYAESVDIAVGRDSIGPGDLVVIDAERSGQFLKSTEAYSTLISGVYATKPGVTGRRQPKDKSSDDEVPMAMIGIVPTKVSTENGPIHRGDLLVSATTPGFAMKGTDHSRMMGAVIGKALAPLETGSGVIEVLISLQ